MDKQTIAMLIQEGSKLISGIMQTYGIRRPHAPLTIPDRKEDLPTDQPQGDRVTTEQTIEYQKREITKELILLEKHLLQGCKIGGKACDCCEKHPIALEGLAQETSGMTSEPVYRELSNWIRTISPMTSEAASASGEYDEEYPRLAIKAREFRKAIMPSAVAKEMFNESLIKGGGNVKRPMAKEDRTAEVKGETHTPGNSD